MDACPVGVGVHRPGVAPAGEQQRVGGLLGHPLDAPQETRRPLAASSTSWTLCFETWAVRAIAFCESPFTDLSLRTSLALILLAMWNLLVLWTAWQPERNGDAREGI